MIQQQRGRGPCRILPSNNSLVKVSGCYIKDKCPLFDSYGPDYILASYRKLLSAPSIICHTFCMLRLFGNDQSGYNKKQQ